MLQRDIDYTSKSECKYSYISMSFDAEFELFILKWDGYLMDASCVALRHCSKVRILNAFLVREWLLRDFKTKGGRAQFMGFMVQNGSLETVPLN